MEDVTTQLEVTTPPTGFIGVDWHQHRQYKHPWRACLKHCNLFYDLGHYPTAEMAARVRDVGAKVLRGPNAQLNFDGEPPLGVSVESIRQRILSRQAKKGVKTPLYDI